MADDADAVILLPLTTFLTADSYAAVNSTAVPITGTLGTIKLILMKYLTILLSIFLLSCSSPSIIDYKPEKFKFKSDKPFVFRKDKNLYFEKMNFAKTRMVIIKKKPNNTDNSKMLLEI